MNNFIKYRQVLRLLLFLYGKRTYSIDELATRLEVSTTSINQYLKVLRGMPELGYEKSGSGYFTRIRIDPDTTVFTKELKSLCRKLEQG